MVATFLWKQRYGTSPGTEATATNLNLVSNTSGVDQTPATFPVIAGQNSYELFVRMNFTGTFTKVDNLQFWKSAGAYVTGESIVAKTDWTAGTSTYTTPVATASTVATVAVATADPGTANVTIGNALAGSLVAAGYSDYIVLQLQTTGSTPPGAVNQKTFSANYDEQ